MLVPSSRFDITLFFRIIFTTLILRRRGIAVAASGRGVFLTRGVTGRRN
jgi:hypothetical protein